MTPLTRKILLLVVFGLIVVAGAFYFLKSKNPNNGEVIITTTPGNIFSKGTPTPVVISSDFPPLYPEVEWGEPKSGKFFFTDTENATTEQAGYTQEGITTEVLSEKMIDYYDKELLKRGWKQTLDAGGPPGLFFGYQKGNLFFNFGVRYTPEGPGPDRRIIKYTVYIETI